MSAPIETRSYVGHFVKAKPQNGEQSYVYGSVLCQRGSAIYVYFTNLDPRLSNWYRTDQVVYTGIPVPDFKPPQISDIRNIDYIVFANQLIKVWYFSPYPPPYSYLSRLFVCERCLKYGTIQYGMKHVPKCKQAPLGLKIYEDDKICFYEVDGRTEKLFCQFLCLFTRLFLDSKSLYYNTDWFLFYVMTIKYYNGGNYRYTKGAYQTLEHPPLRPLETIVGYFSKEKQENNVLSCIMTFPNHMQKGLGFHLIDFAYMLAKIENRIAGPEEPLSDLGHKSFMKYWKVKLMENVVEKATEFYESPCIACNENSRPGTPIPPLKDRRNYVLFVDLKEVAIETSIAMKHILLAAEEITFRIRRNNEVGITPIQHKQFSEILQNGKRGGFYDHRLNVKFLQWEPYPVMFCGPRE